MTPNRRRPNRSTRRGQGMTEYIIIVALMGIATIGIITLFGDNLRRLFAMSADSLAGGESISQANTVGAVAKLGNHSLKDFAYRNNPY
jgi:Flp pilus assembly pilin Flp